MSNGTSTARKSLQQESEMDTCHPLPSSLMCVSSFSPVQLSSTEDLRMWLQLDSHANHSVLPESSLQQATIETCGPQQGTLFASLDPITSSWKTCQASFLVDTQEPLLVTWPRWGMWVNGDAYQLLPLAQSINGADGGLWPTPLARDARTLLGAARSEGSAGTDPLAAVVAKKEFLDKGNPVPQATRLNPEWVEWLMGWPSGWTDLRPLEMDKFQQWLELHGS